MKLVIGSDHGGIELKNNIRDYFLKKDFEVNDVGTYSLDSCDYPDFGIKAAQEVASGHADYGILVCTSGEGISIAANKVKGIRCGIAYNDEVAQLIKLHNNANMIAFGAKYTTAEEAIKRVEIFLNTEFDTVGGRHVRRVGKITEFENK